MRKIFVSVIIIIAILVATLPTSAVTADSRASDYFSYIEVQLAPGSSSGEIALSYEVGSAATGITRLGIAAIFVYRTDGTMARVITGSTSNGLMKTSGTVAAGTYRISMEPGVTYYCNIRFLAENANGFDSRHITTNTAVAHR